MGENIKKSNVLFEDIGNISNKNYDWFSTNGLIIDVGNNDTSIKMPNKGMFNYSPNVCVSGDFDLSMEIYMPNGSSFLSFGFSNNQKVFSNFKGWWNTDGFQKLTIKRFKGYVKYYLDNQFKVGYELNSNELFFQFRIYSIDNLFEFKFKNFKIINLDYGESTNLYMAEQIENLESKVKFLTSKFDAYEKNTNKILDSYHYYFNTLFVDYDLKPKKLLKLTHCLCQELLDFVDNLCVKYDLKYWLFAGNLLGAFRHEGFIPWDDDMDIAMMREDYNKFIEIIEFELEKNDLDNDIEFRINYKSNENTINTFVQLFIFNDGLLFAGLDIFPHDFLKEPKENFDEVFLKVRNNHFVELINGTPRNVVYNKIYKELNLTFNEEKYISFGVEFAFPSKYNRLYLESNKVFPLKSVLFEGKYYPCPNDIKYYLDSFYTSNNQIPKIVEFHSRQNALKNKKNSIQIYENFIKKMKKINKNLSF